MNPQDILAGVETHIGLTWQRLAQEDVLRTGTAVAIALAGGWLLVQGVTWLRRGGAGALPPPGAGEWPGGAALRRKAKRLARGGDAREAARLFEMLGDLDRAGQQYERARAYVEAAGVHQRERRWERAAGLYERAGDLVRAAECLQQAGSHRQAAHLFFKAGREIRGAEALEQGRHYAEAAAVYERAGALERAAALYERAGSFGAAAEVLERHLLARYGAGRGESSAAGSLTAGGLPLLQRCAALYRVAQQPARAADALMRWGATGEAAQLFLEGGEPRRALELYRAAGHLAEALEICQLIGAQAEYHAVRAEQFARAGAAREAAEAWELAGEPDRAAEVYRELRDWARAAELYSRAGCHDAAGEMFEATGQWARAGAAYAAAARPREAGRCYRQAGMPREAAAVMAQGGDLYGAGALLAKSDAPDEAITLLQQVPPASPDYGAAGLALARLLLERGMARPALERLRAVPGEPPAAERVEINYLLGRANEALGRVEEALAHYERVLAERMDYEDAATRAAVLGEQVATPPAGNRSTVVVGRRGGAQPRYRVLRELGRGGMGIVYEAHDQVLMRPVALKVPAPAIQGSPRARQRFLREARIAAALRHPNIVTIYDAGEGEDGLYIAMELIGGISLEAHLEERGPLPPAEMLPLARQMCAGLIHAHAHGIVHADVKPANMIVDSAGAVHLTDFGLARAWEESGTATEEARGTPFYIAPEQVRGDALDARTDIYSLGCTLYRMVAGRPPFTKGDVLHRHQYETPPPLRGPNAAVPEALEEAILRCLAKRLDDRFPSVAHLLNALELAIPPGGPVGMEGRAAGSSPGPATPAPTPTR